MGWVVEPLWAGVFTFVQAFIFWAVNIIAVEIHNPFGQDANDLNAARLQGELNRQLLMLMDPATQRIPTLVRGTDNRDLSDHLTKLDSSWSLYDIWTASGDIELPSRTTKGRRERVNDEISDAARMSVDSLTPADIAEPEDDISR